jgi:hypothetical protein
MIGSINQKTTNKYEPYYKFLNFRKLLLVTVGEEQNL